MNRRPLQPAQIPARSRYGVGTDGCKDRLLDADAVVEDDGGEVDEGVFVVAGGDATPWREAYEVAFDGVALFAQVGVGVWCPAAA